MVLGHNWPTRSGMVAAKHKRLLPEPLNRKILGRNPNKIFKIYGYVVKIRIQWVDKGIL